ncbi:nuclear pore complex protein Nup98-Nup96 [Cataglyphis hispanica]|uniref:nuclear pore complex protein Nup98-Nup96 n=1 Tax=Cataglyphis hispanica TaxID=1086592 RepID=UPI00217F9241|nr:nuclear pore complex protein Nup98-Nup96 [Cataglyphis hispanica]
MFGQTGNTSFSGFSTATQNSPFAQSAFGKPITTTSFGSGAAPVFGSSNTSSLFSSKPTGSTTGGLFGNTTTPPAFRQPTNTQPSFGGFGTTNTSTNLFGTQQNAGTNLFGTSTGTSAFGQTNKPGSFSFGTTSGPNLFGQPQQNTQQTTPFGQSNTTTNTNLFGTTAGFGNTNTTVPTGTVVKFTPVITTDSMSKNGISHSISARHCCIASMKEYESKSYEELRFEDYQVGRKGPQTGLFGTSAQTSPFANTAAGTSTGGTGFGSMAAGFGTTSQSGSTGLFGKPITNFGTPATTTTNNFAFNSTPTTNLFGTNTQTKPFGTAAPTPLFGTSNTNHTAGTGFGSINTGQTTGFGSAFGSTQPNQSIGLFNQNKSAFNIPSTSTSTGFTSFGQAATNNTTTTPLFGNKTNTTGFGTTSTFGAAAPSTFGTNTGFNSASNTGSSLFNSSFKPAGQTSGFSFGTTPASSTGLGTNTGLSLNTGSSLFGQQKPGSLFGNTGSNTTFNNPGTFGSSTFGTSSNMMSGTGMSLLNGGIVSNQTKTNGLVPVHQQILALVSAPFGDSPLLKNLLPASGKTEELLKPTNPTSKVLNSPHYRVTTNNKSPKIKAKVVSSVQLSKKSLFDGLEEEDPVLTEAFQPRPNAKRLVLRPKSATNSSVQSPIENGESVARNNSMDDKTDTSNMVHSNNIEVNNKENYSQDNNRIANDRRLSTSWLKSTLPRRNKIPDDELLEAQRSPFSATNVPEEVNNTVAELRPHNNTSNTNHSDTINSIEMPLNSTFDDKSSANLTMQNADSSQETNENSFLMQSNWNLNMAKVTLRRVGYYTIPPLDKLDDFVCGETCIIPNFTIGREGYGNVYFPDSFDVYGLNLDEIVHFRHKEVIIYPDDEKKPPVGQGLNRRAQVTLDKVWPHDKSLHEPITDPQRLAAMNYEGKLRRVSAKHDTRFLEYRPETGSWVFKVEHFSKYGLSDSDEDDNQVLPASEAKKLKGFPVSLQKGKIGEPSAATSKDAINGAINGTVGGTKIENAKHLDIVENNFLGETQIRFDHDDRDKWEMVVHPSRDTPIGRSVFISRDYSYEKRMTVSPVGDNARVAGTDSHKVQLMKASFFDTNDEDMSEEINQDIFPSVKKTLTHYFSNVTEIKNDKALCNSTMSRSIIMNEIPFSTSQENLLSISGKKQLSRVNAKNKQEIIERVIPPITITPITSVLKYHYEIVPLKQSRLNRLRFRCIADTGIQMGRMFRPSWGAGLTLLSLSTQDQATKVQLQSTFSQLSHYVSGRLADDTTSTAIVQRLQILSGDEHDITMFKDSIERHLRIQLDHCVMGHERDCPIFNVATDNANRALQLHCTLAQDLAEKEQRLNENISDEHHSIPERSFHQYASIVWTLCVALWGKYTDQDMTSNANEEHYNVMMRREAVSEWLKNVVQKTVEQEIKNIDGEIKNSHEKMILSLLSACKLEDACQEARKTGDHCLALLMAQLRGGMPVKELIKQQLALWQQTDVDENLTIDRLKLFMLAAGEPLISSKHGTINVCEDLDWKRVFAIHLWYLSSPTCSITDALDLYEASFNMTEYTQIYAAIPEPEYRKNDYDAELSNGKQIYDLCFHLLKLYCTGNHDLGELLNPLSYTANPLDYRLSWLIQQILVALGYTHLSDHVAALTHTNFATQLEAYGLWHWAIFVMLHLRDSSRRQIAVQDLLLRHIEIDDSPEYMKREQFLKEELGISSIWIHQAKAIKSRIDKRFGEAAWYYIQAEQWTQAHEIIIEHLAADAIINENYEYLKSLLIPLVPAEYSSTINSWAHQGQLLWEYMEITNEIQNLLKSTPDYHGITYQLEALKPRLTSLCHKIDQFPCPTAKHRLCQAEIAKRTLHLARNLLLLQKNEKKSVTKLLVRLISQLPLPEDYAQQELRPIVNMRVTEVISQ